ncbi:MAG: hypothetical protein R2715_01095 [Ilumatobacteraceae bacterium]
MSYRSARSDGRASDDFLLEIRLEEGLLGETIQRRLDAWWEHRPAD